MACCSPARRSTCCYLRALGAKIGRGVAIFSRDRAGGHRPDHDRRRHGDPQGLLVHRLPRAWPAGSRSGRSRIGRDAFVGEKTVLDIDTAIGDGAQLGHTSSLHAGQAVPAGAELARLARPSRPTVDYRTVAAGRAAAPLRRSSTACCSCWAAAGAGAAVALTVAGRAGSPAVPPLVDRLLGPGNAALASRGLLRWTALVVAFVLFFGRAARRAARDDHRAPAAAAGSSGPAGSTRCTGCATSSQRAITRLTNSQFFMLLLGDSSFIVRLPARPRLRPVRGRADRVELRHRAGARLAVADHGRHRHDGLRRAVDHERRLLQHVVPDVARSTVGAHNFVGNNIAFPAGARIGENVPAGHQGHGPDRRPGPGERRPARLAGVRDPALASARDAEFDYLNDPAEAAPPAARARTGTTPAPCATVAAALGCPVLRQPAARRDRAGPLPAVRRAGRRRRGLLSILVFNVVYSALLERAVLGLPAADARGSARSTTRTSGGHERLWKVYVDARSSTAPRSSTLIWRLAGVRIGRRVFDDGCVIPEKTLVTHRRRRGAQRRQRHPVPLAGGRQLQVRPHPRSAPAPPSASTRSCTTA